MPPRSPTVTSPVFARRGSARTRSSRWWYAPPSGRRAGNTPSRSRHWPAQPTKRWNHDAGNPRPRSSIAHQGDPGADSGVFGLPRRRRREVGVLPARFLWRGAPHTHEAMRGQSDWSIGDRELMAAYISKTNDCPFCVSAHSATSTMFYGDETKVAETLTDLDSAPIDEPLRATLRMLGKLTRQNSIDADDIRAVLDAGGSPRQIKEALAVSFAFNITDRLANAFGFTVASPEAMNAGARHL